MSANRRRGEIAAMLNGEEYRLCLTLGALAELETAFEADDLGALVERFSNGRLSASDLVRVIGAGLRGGGAAVTDDDVRAMRCDNGAAGYAWIVSELLAVTFGAPESGPSVNP
ncbi:MAG TPA: gene transfer agent family protein [Rhizobiaceae bacterium]|nr:gene transfer agent family protein [Rhizobiaceae bacterium]